MENADRRFRTWMMQPAQRAIRVCLFALLALCQLVLGLLKHFVLAGTPALQAGTAILFLLPFVLLLYFVFRTNREATPLQLLFCGALCLLAMVLRLCFIDRDTGDFEYYLSGWISAFGERTFGESMRMQVGEYHVLYQYCLFLIARLPLPPLYLVKALSFIGDVCLAGAALAICQCSGIRDMRGLIVLFLPAVILNAGMFAQCDALYTACALWGIALVLQERPGAGMACFALSFCLKLQSIFILPILLVFWSDGRITLRDVLIFIGTLLLVQVPALLGGKTPAQLLAIYTDQTGLYTGLNYGAPNLWAIVHSEGLDPYAYGTFGIALAAGADLFIVGLAIARGQARDTASLLHCCALLALCSVFFLPRMHERYIYPAEILAVLLAMHDFRALPAAALVSLASLCVLWETAIPLWGSACLVLAAIVFLMVQAASDDRLQAEKQNSGNGF